ncbi:PQQ-dependent sugar dehydrogenase [Actinoalloteichus spitiensis]|uniref:PQQ-dependent sugar dehydrogenase n=1 Tax=Actinoalloteichus spitiensis TaxID=252394 RepID=UPI000378D765|nr:PQQ-dependent sugar dehydrogenase [Actinoalloteichus spitiensis]
MGILARNVRVGVGVLGAGTLLVLTACGGEDATGHRPDGSPPPSGPPPAGLEVREVAGGLEHGWGVGFLPEGDLLVTERPGRLTLVSGTEPGATTTEVAADLSDVFVEGEGGLMDLVVHEDFAETRRFTTCQTHQDADGTPVDVRLVTWRLAPDGGSADRVVDPLLQGLPVNDSGRHSGCRLALDGTGALLVGTGDAARPDTSQDLTSLGGKVLRLDPASGGPAEGNPFAEAEDAARRLVLTYGHRNVQGVAPRPGGDQVLVAEHGPDVDDEVNLLEPGANYGWDPSRGGATEDYDESVPMTDRERFPDAVPAAWSSGSTTEALCDAVFLTGERWGPFDGMLAVTALRGSKLLLFELDEAGAVTGMSVPPELDGTHGRLRAAELGPDGALYLTTSNGEDDQVLRVSPA